MDRVSASSIILTTGTPAGNWVSRSTWSTPAPIELMNLRFGKPCKLPSGWFQTAAPITASRSLIWGQTCTDTVLSKPLIPSTHSDTALLGATITQDIFLYTYYLHFNFTHPLIVSDIKPPWQECIIFCIVHPNSCSRHYFLLRERKPSVFNPDYCSIQGCPIMLF